MKDKFAFFEAYQNPIPKRRKLLAKTPFLYKSKKGPNKNKLDWVNFSATDCMTAADLRKQRTLSPPKEKRSENFSGLREKSPGRW